MSCKYERIGCHWQGPFHERQAHEAECNHPKKSGDDIMAALDVIDKNREDQTKHYERIFSLLSFEKIAFSGRYLHTYAPDTWQIILKKFIHTLRHICITLTHISLHFHLVGKYWWCSLIFGGILSAQHNHCIVNKIHKVLWQNTSSFLYHLKNQWSCF